MLLCVRRGKGITCVYTALRTVVLLVVCVTDWVTKVNIVVAGEERACSGEASEAVWKTAFYLHA